MYENNAMRVVYVRVRVPSHLKGINQHFLYVFKNRGSCLSAKIAGTVVLVSRRSQTEGCETFPLQFASDLITWLELLRSGVHLFDYVYWTQVDSTNLLFGYIYTTFVCLIYIHTYIKTGDNCRKLSLTYGRLP